MAIVSEAGQVTRKGKSKLRAVPKPRESKASEPKPPKQGKEKKPKDSTRCDLCGATDQPVRYHEGNACCEACAEKAPPPASASTTPKAAKKEPAKTQSPPAAEPKLLGASKIGK